MSSWKILNTQHGIKAIDQGDSNREGKEEDLNSQLELVETKWEQFLKLEIEIEKK